MLTVHDYTFELSWQGWGKHTPRVEQVARAIFCCVLAMSAEEVRRLATRETVRSTMVQGARVVLKNALARKGGSLPPTGVLRLEVVNAPQ